jgi:hypothetical protein
MFCNFYLAVNSIIANNAATTDAKLKISAYMESLEVLKFFTRVQLNLKAIKFYSIKLATFIKGQLDYLLYETSPQRFMLFNMAACHFV